MRPRVSRTHLDPLPLAAWLEPPNPFLNLRRCRGVEQALHLTVLPFRPRKFYRTLYCSSVDQGSTDQQSAMLADAGCKRPVQAFSLSAKIQSRIMSPPSP